MDGVKGTSQAPAVAQKLVKPPEGKAGQGEALQEAQSSGRLFISA